MNTNDNIHRVLHRNKYQDQIWQPGLLPPLVFLTVAAGWLEKTSQHLVEGGVSIHF